MAIDAANGEDPNVLWVQGVERPKELVHAEVVERWVRRLDPLATDAQLLAARAHHLRRWVVPRTEYPEGRSGYLRWRTDQKRRQAAEVAALLTAAGQDQVVVDRVAELVAKRGLGSDPQVQTHEDALCLAFLELQFGALIERLGEERAAGVVRKTAAKMSPAALAATAELSFDGRERQVFTAALADP